MNRIKPIANAKNQKIGIVVACFYQDIADRLLDGALKCITHYGGDLTQVTVVDVPGAFEVPQTVQQILQTKKYHAIVTLGLVIQGETPHFDYLNQSMAQQISFMSVQSNIPITFGILTTLTKDQALQRSQENNNKGWEVMKTALGMISVLKDIKNDD